MAKILLTDIQQEAKDIQWILLSDEYKNLKGELKFKCDKGHEVITSYEKWRRTHICPICQLKEKENQAIDCIVPKGKEDYRLLALDQATKVTGWAIFQNGELIRHGVYCLDEMQPVQYRINEVKQWLWNMIKVWKIDFVQLEDIQLQEHKDQGNDIGVTTYKILAQLQGVLENLVFSNQVPYGIVSPNTWRAYNQIKGRNKTDKKKNAQLLVKDLYSITVPLDEAEAICIGRYGITQCHRKKVEIVEWN